ncbi:AAA family ATPase, partial [archaeon]|nr:AAA family ATPase [archaeon]
MYLKEVVLENFKSFGKKTRVPFLQGFTAVTGPNASGKSNISDAVLFVLGPKSSKVVRAGKLTDLIFNGGNGRKNPGYCKVSLVFDNSDRTIPLDSNEVTLTRLVKYANNPENYYSYFYVNGKTSSLTEFENLLAHAHISADG